MVMLTLKQMKNMNSLQSPHQAFSLLYIKSTMVDSGKKLLPIPSLKHISGGWHKLCYFFAQPVISYYLCIKTNSGQNFMNRHIRETRKPFYDQRLS